MRLLLDTCAGLWLFNDQPELSDAARAAVADPENELIIHQVTLWEMTLKHSLGKLPLLAPPGEVLAEGMARYGIGYATLADEDIAVMGNLPFHHRDPFDRLLIAHAKRRGLTLVSPDAAWSAYGVPVLW